MRSPQSGRRLLGRRASHFPPGTTPPRIIAAALKKVSRMSGFSPEWLTLREPADHRARDAMLGLQLADRLQKRADLTVTDLGCGTGSNIRATYALLGREQHWTLVDYDPSLLAAARAPSDRLGRPLRSPRRRARTDQERQASGRRFRRGRPDQGPRRGARRQARSGHRLGAVRSLLGAFIERFAKAVAARRAVFYTVLTYNGIQRWTPKHAADETTARKPSMPTR